MKSRQYIKILIFGLLCLFLTGVSHAQELLIGLGENARIARPPEQVKTKGFKSEPSGLPFVDDFANSAKHTVDGEKWTDRNVFINDSYAINPPTIGVATFDAFDKSGKLYPAAGPVVFAADTLTSRIIDLSVNLPSDSLYLSFFYQPGGYGDMPEPDDIFVLQFRVKGGEWKNVWSASANLIDSTITIAWEGAVSTSKVTDIGQIFYRAQLKIENPDFLHSGFQFRFVNYASIIINRNAPGRSTTTDHWHLDYVYLDKNRRATDFNLPDVALSVQQLPLSTVYESIPAIHLSSQDAINELFPDPMILSLTYSNLGWGTKSVSRNFRLYPLYGTGSTVQFGGGSENIYDDQSIRFDFHAPKYNFTTTNDSAAFEIKSYLVTDSDTDYLRTNLRYNDTTSYIQYFRNYYAYDDGTAENGYGLFGNNTANGKVAVQFQSYKTDSIRGVYMYFNRTVSDANAVSFHITVWSDFNGLPDTVMYTGRVTKPVFKDSLNQFVAYKFAKAISIEKGVPYYVGWTQMTDAFLDIGFDRNRNHQDKNFFNIYDSWEPSIYEGSLMIRPIFTRTATDFPGDYEPTVPPAQIEESSNAFIVYPNPVLDGRLFIAEDNTKHTPVNAQRVDIYDAMGRLMLKTSSSEGNLDVSTLSAGIYIIRVWENDEFKGAKRIIIAK
ncbi:MAG: T9SS type A sorting domain-containing protein [Prevotellaceae bacterium]|nr:T9SS type A sorting domain-containing protein [Prevotellaceae bacterium]